MNLTARLWYKRFVQHDHNLLDFVFIVRLLVRSTECHGPRVTNNGFSVQAGHGSWVAWPITCPRVIKCCSVTKVLYRHCSTIYTKRAPKIGEILKSCKPRADCSGGTQHRAQFFFLTTAIYKLRHIFPTSN